MPRPIIGITIDRNDDAERYESPFSYAKAIELAGGLPLLFPYKTDIALIPQYVDLIDGLLLSGGNDLDPALYGQVWHEKAERIDPDRQKFDMALLAEIERRRTPVLGVCLGSQIMNVYRGGSLHQFLPDISRDAGLEHRKVGPDLKRHSVRLDTNSQIGRAIGKPEISVNTYHKQSADRIGRGLVVVATAPDGVIEGFEDPSFPLFAAVQWHPERLTDEPEHLAPFKLLVEKSKGTHGEDESSVESGSIDRDLPCISCGYNLRGLALGGLCPECGNAIEKTARNLAEYSSWYAHRDGSKKFQSVAQESGYPVDAFMLVTDVLSCVQRQKIHGQPIPLVGAGEICGTFAEFCGVYFNDRAEALDLLMDWKLVNSKDLGAVIHAMKRHGLLKMANYPPLEDFNGIFDSTNLPRYIGGK